jgi:HD-GYP domain-containing protein (c-di-GMP phosphodiesterase class II)
MHKLSVDLLQPGMVLAKSIDNERGDALLAKGVTLTQLYIDALKEHGYHSVYVRNGIADDVEPPQILSPLVRELTYRHLKDLFNVLESATTEAKTDDERREIIEQIALSIKPQFSELRKDVEKIVDEVVGADTITGIVSLKSYDNYTFEHSVEVTVVGIVLGKRLRLTISELHQLALGCLCHDIGKLVVPKTLLGKPGKLTDEEFAIIQRHPQAGFDAVQRLMGQSDIIARHIVRQHHERQDGNGYPRGLRGSNRFVAGKPAFGQGLMLPAAEISAVADVYSAIASDRPYRPAMSPQQIISTMGQMAGTHLNRDVVTKFMTILPSYPIGTDVIVIEGRLRGFRGIITDVKPSHINAPVLRVMFDPQGHTVAAFEVDTSKEMGLVLAVIPPELLAPRRTSAQAAT